MNVVLAGSVSLAKRACAEAVGTAFLLAAIVGSGIMAQHLAEGNAAVALLANSLATGGALVALILTIGPISGAHLNPVVTLVQANARAFSWYDVPAYIAAQTGGAIAGVVIANLMFGLPAVTFSNHVRSGGAQLLGEVVATFGLVFVIRSCARSRPELVSFAVATYIVGAYWFTSSTSFANPAVTIARSLSDTFAGIRLEDVTPFILAQVAGAACASGLFEWIIAPERRNVAPSAQLRTVAQREPDRAGR